MLIRNKLQFFIERENFTKSKEVEVQKKAIQKIQDGKASGIKQNIILPVYIVIYSLVATTFWNIHQNAL
jgi:hypothetical protein